jgi:hypothetical protein
MTRTPITVDHLYETVKRIKQRQVLTKWQVNGPLFVMNL